MIGGIFIICGSAGFGFCLCREMEAHIRQLQQLVRAFTVLRSEMTYSRATLPEACRRAGEKENGGLGAAFSGIYRRMEGEEGTSFPDIWQQVWESHLKDSGLSGEEKELLLSFPAYTGFMDAGCQDSSVERFIGDLQERLEELKNISAGRRKVLLSLSTVGGIVLAIILL